jgi:hypothetical protein
MRKANLEQPFHAMYNYAYITDAQEGLILTEVNTLADGEPRNNALERALTWNAGGALDGARHITVGGYYLYITTARGLSIVSVDTPLTPKLVAQVPLKDARASFLQFRYLFVTDAEGLKTIDVTDVTTPRLVAGNVIRLMDAQRVFVARTYAYVAAGRDGIVIVDAERPESLREYQRFTAEGVLSDARDVIVATTNASLFAYVADGRNGLRVVQLTSPQSQPKLIASYATKKAALSLSRGLERDRAVDETGNQIAVFGRRGARPLNLVEMRNLFLDANGKPWYVSDAPGSSAPTVTAP